MTQSSRRRGIVLAIAGSGLVGVVWFALSMATGLLFHLMPGATFMAAGWTFRSLVRQRATNLEGVLLLGVAGLVTAAGLVAIPAAGGFVGDAVENLIVVSAGLVLGARWLLRTGTAPGADTADEAADAAEKA